MAENIMDNAQILGADIIPQTNSETSESSCRQPTLRRFATALVATSVLITGCASGENEPSITVSTEASESSEEIPSKEPTYDNDTEAASPISEVSEPEVIDSTEFQYREDVDERLLLLQVPEEYTEKSIEVERAIYKAIDYNDHEWDMVIEEDKRHLWMWRGSIIVPTTVVGGPEREHTVDAWMRLDNPLEVVVGRELYWAAYHPVGSQIISIKFGEVDENGELHLDDIYDKSELRPSADNPNSGLFAQARPIEIDHYGNGIRYVDTYEKLLRDKHILGNSEVWFYSDKTEATRGLGDRLDYAEDKEIMFREANQVDL